jgi:dienelactone hydrolase
MKGLKAVAIACLLAGCAFNGPGGPIPFVAIGGARGPENGLDGKLRLPPGKGPFPVAIVLHGCNGINVNQSLWADRLNSWGYAAFILDSFGPRGVKNVCAPIDQSTVKASDRASDVISAALWLRTQPGIDPARIAVLGNSHGGATAAWVTQAMYDRLYPGLLKAAVNYYGACRNPPAHGTVPLLALAGSADGWGWPAPACEAYGHEIKGGQPFEVHVYPGVFHSFDNPRIATLTMNEGHKLLYDQAAAEDSFRRVRAFLGQWLEPAKN